MADEGEIVLSTQPAPKEKLMLRVFSRSLGLLGSHTYETQDELLKKFFPDKTHVVYYQGVDDLDQIVHHWFETKGEGDIGGIVIVPLKDRKVLPVSGMPSMPPNSGPPGSRRSR